MHGITADEYLEAISLQDAMEKAYRAAVLSDWGSRKSRSEFVAAVCLARQSVQRLTDLLEREVQTVNELHLLLASGPTCESIQ